MPQSADRNLKLGHYRVLFRLVFVVFVELEVAGFDGFEQMPGPGLVRRRHKNFHGTQLPDFESVDFSEAFAADGGINLPGAEECADLLGLSFSIGNEDAASFFVHHRTRPRFSGKGRALLRSA